MENNEVKNLKEEMSALRETPNSPKAARNFLGQNSECHPKVFLKTFGCQMNEYDSELVRSILEGEGYCFVDSDEKADVVLLNTCSVRENAHRKVFGHIHEIRHRRNKGDSPRSARSRAVPIIGVLGCMATALKEELLNNKSLNIDFIAGPDSYRSLPELIEKCIEGRKTLDVGRETLTKKRHTSYNLRHTKPFDITLSEFETYADIYPKREKGVNAWIAIMRGCNNFCTFCIVPYTRCRERSRSPKSIIDETKKLVSEGYPQVTLLGQNVNSYKYKDTGFTKLIEQVSEVKGIRRVRFASPHPKDFPEGLIELIASNPKICKHIHLPLQAGSNRILKMMNRPYTKAGFLKLAYKLKTKCPEITLTTDVIVGFPTETDKEFQDTLDVMKKVEFNSAFMFKYSERKGTIASHKYKDDVESEKKTERIVKLNELQKNISLKRNELQIGKISEILIENESFTKSKNFFQGRNTGNVLVTIPQGNYKCGDFINVKITHASPFGLTGIPI